MSSESRSGQLPLLGTLLAVVCLAYFYAVDRVIVSSAGFSTIFRYLLLYYDVSYAWLTFAITLAAVFWTGTKPIVALVEWVARHVGAIALSSIVLLSCGTLFVYHNYPLCMDEYAAVFQSKVFAGGHLTAHLPPSLIDWLFVSGFNGTFLIASPLSGRVVEGYWPGYALVLAPFQVLGVPWLCNPVMAGISLLLISRITALIAVERVAVGFAVLFTVCSGAFVANAISLYSMQAHMTMNLLFAWLLMRPTVSRAAVAGVVGSLALVLHNPLPHFLFAVPWIAAIAWHAEQRKFLLPLLAGYLPLSLLLGVGWLWFRAPIQADLHDIASLGSVAGGVFKWPTVVMLNMRIAAAAKMWVWAVPCLFLFAAVGALRFRDRLHVRLLAFSAVLTFAGYLFVDLDQGHGWGYRYFHSAWGVIPVLAALAMTGRSDDKRRLLAFAGAAAVLSLAFVVTYQLSQVGDFVALHLMQIAQPRRPGNNVYFVSPEKGFYLADMAQTDPYLRDRDLYLVSHGAVENERLIHTYWPDAIKQNRGFLAEQWYLGDADQRVSRPGAVTPHFEFDR